MLQRPYQIAVIAPISQEPTAEQMNWMVRRLRMLAKSALSLGLTGDCLQVQLYPMSRLWKDGLPYWAAHWRRPEHAAIMPLRQVHAWPTEPHAVVLELVAWDVDEVWCLNSGGHGQWSPCPQARVWRASQQVPEVAPKFKLVPSWVNSDVLEQPAVKERKRGTDGASRNSTPRKADRGQARGRPGNASNSGRARRYP